MERKVGRNGKTPVELGYETEKKQLYGEEQRLAHLCERYCKEIALSRTRVMFVN